MKPALSDSDARLTTPPTPLLLGDGASARAYIADLATELSELALCTGEARLAEALGRAADLARERA